jgi:hypothetical protein
MRITVVSPVPLFPPHGGNRARMLTLITQLRKLGHHVNFVLLDSRKKGDYAESSHVEFFGESFFILKRNPLSNALYLSARAWKMFTRLLKRRLGLRDLQSVDEIYFRPFTRQVAALENHLKSDIACVEYVQFSRAFAAFGQHTYKILDTHDSATGLVEADEEAAAFRRANAVLAIQDCEADMFRSQLGHDADRVAVVSHLLDLEQRLDVSNTIGATFVGSSFDANIASIRYFIDEVLPRVISELPWFKLSVAGSICNDIPDHPSILKLGRVDTLRTAFEASPISINPTRKGTGVKIKLLESMSCGVPIVSTEHGVRGIDPAFLTGVLRVRDKDARTFADAVIELAVNRSLRERLSESAYACAVRWHERQLDALKAILTNAQNHPRKIDASLTTFE